MRKIGALWNPNTKFSFWMLSLLLTVILMGIPFTWAEAQVEIITLISIHQIPFVILIHRQNRFSFGVLYPGWNWCEWIQIFASGTGYGGFICRGLFGVKPYTYRFFHEGHHGEWKKNWRGKTSKCVTIDPMEWLRKIHHQKAKRRKLRLSRQLFAKLNFVEREVRKFPHFLILWHLPCNYTHLSPNGIPYHFGVTWESHQVLMWPNVAAREIGIMDC